ncbi:MAG: hypothetical protein RMH77_00390 [Sulfolobales archaeon]|nr:hypothetical protein [Sulfolobales archaeon]
MGGKPSSALVGVLVVLVIVAGVGGYFAGSSAVPPPRTVTSVVTQTVTTTAAAATVTVTSTITPPPQTVTSTVTLPPRTVTVTVTPTPTPTVTPTERIIMASLIDVAELLKLYSLGEVRITIFNSTSRETEKYTFRYNWTKGEFSGQDVIVIDTTFEEDSIRKIANRFWVTHNFEVAHQAQMDGQIIPSPYADISWKTHLGAMSGLIILLGGHGQREVFQFVVFDGLVKPVKDGWLVDAFSSTRISISGRTYSGYYGKATNVNDVESIIKSIEGRAAELIPNSYYLVYWHVIEKDGDVFTIELTELIPAI